MNRPTLEVADIIRVAGDSFIEKNRAHLAWPQLKVLRAIRDCRTAALGGHLDRCSRCGHQAISYNSCRNRHCPKCQTNAREQWFAKRSEDLLDVPYFHVVFQFRMTSLRSCCRTRRHSTPFSFGRALKPYWKSPPTQSTSAPGSAF